MRRVASTILAFLLITVSVADHLAAEELHPAIGVLRENCSKCHGAEKTAGKLDTRTQESLIVGGKRGPAILPGNASKSRLIQLLQPGAKPHMPPGKKQLSQDDIESLTNWIDGLPVTERTTAEVARAELHQAPFPTSDAAENEKWLPPRGTDPTTVIDLLIQAKYTPQNIVPNSVAADATFLRRIYLDLIGRIPTASEAKAFRDSTDSLKRNQVIDQLIASDDFAKHMALAFDVILMGRNERRLDDRRNKGWHTYLENAFRHNRPWDQVAREVLLARADSKDRGHVWFLHEHNNKHQEIAEAISRGFFGVDIACAQCHDHPLADEIKQAHYWGLVAFFNRSTNTNAPNGFAVAESAIGGFNDFANALAGTTESASLLFLQRSEVQEDRPADPAKQTDSEELYVEVKNEPRVPKFSRREKFVEEILDDHPLLARSMVNRVWALLMGRGIVHPADRMDSEHIPSHPALLDWLARDFHESNYDVKRLVRNLVRTRTYQLESGLPKHATPASFASGLEKPLTAESLTNSMAVALAVDANATAPQFRKLFPEVLPDNDLTSLSQTMMLSNRPELQKMFLDAAKQLSGDKTIVQQVSDLYARIFSREPTESELFVISDYLRARQDRLAEAYSQVLWAMVCSAEFRFNH